MQWKCRVEKIEEILKWIEKRKGVSSFRKNILRAILAASIYNIWRARNDKLWNQATTSEDSVVHRIRYDIVNRIR